MRDMNQEELRDVAGGLVEVPPSDDIPKISQPVYPSREERQAERRAKLLKP